MEMWIQLTIAIISGLTATVPLVIKLVTVSKEAAKAQNWLPLMQLVIQLMIQAEQNHDVADKKKYVLDNISQMQNSLNYTVDIQQVGVMVDSITVASKMINDRNNTTE